MVHIESLRAPGNTYLRYVYLSIVLPVYIYIYMFVYVSILYKKQKNAHKLFIYIYIYIYIEREREREREHAGWGVGWCGVGGKGIPSKPNLFMLARRAYLTIASVPPIEATRSLICCIHINIYIYTHI